MERSYLKSAGARTFRKHLCYVLLFLLLFVLQGTPRFLEIMQVKPLLLVAAAVALAVLEGEFLGGIYGAYAGLLCDTLGFGLFGYTGFTLCVACVIIGLLISQIMQPTLAAYLVYVTAAVVGIYGLHFIFSYGVWRIESMERLFFQKVILVAVYTGAISPILYYLIKSLHRRFQQ